MNEENQDLIDAAGKEQTKKLMEEVIDVFAEHLAAWKVNASSNKHAHQARALFELVLKLRSATDQKLGSNATLSESLLWLGESMLSMGNATK